MAVTYNKLFLLLKEKKISHIDLQNRTDFSGNIITRIKRNKYIRLQNIKGICKVLDCKVDDILEFVEEGK